MREIEVQIPEAFGFLFDPPHGAVRYRAAHGGRGSAKSHSFVQAALVKAMEQPLRVGCYREVEKSIKTSTKSLLDDKIKELKLQDFYQSLDTEIRGRNGSLFIFGGLRTGQASEAVKSTEGLDIAILFEAKRISQKSIDDLEPTIRKAGSEIWAEWNPDLPTDPIDKMFRGEGGPPPRALVHEVNWHDNPWFPEVLREKLEWDRKRDKDKFNHIWGGGYRKNSSTRVFNNWTVEPFEAPANATFRFGADWGFSIDPKVLIRCYLDGRNLYIDYEAYMVGCEIDQTPELFDSIPESRRWLITADSSAPESISYMKRQGFKIMPAVKGARSVEEGVEFLKSYNIIVHPRCVETINELNAYSFEIDELTGNVLPKLADKDNHVIDALRYACEGVRRASTAPAKTVKKTVSIPNTGSGWMAA